MLKRLGYAAAIAVLWALPCLAQQSISPAKPWLRLPDSTVLTRIAFGSCLDQRKPQPIWKAVIAARPQLFLMAGDIVYGDIRKDRTATLTNAYAAQAGQPQLAAARARIPFMATWDDHDFGRNDASASFEHKALTTKLFHEFWQTAPAARERDGVYSARIFGPQGSRVQVIMLDLRSHRSAFAKRSKAERKAAKARGISLGHYKPDGDAAKTMLGVRQWLWLDTELRRSADLRLILSSTQVLAGEHGREQWRNLPHERQRLFDLIRSTKANGAVFLTGDRHASAFYKIAAGADGASYPLYEFMSSGLNRAKTKKDPADPAQITPFYQEDNFGLIDIDWAKRLLRVSIRTVDGREALQLTLPLSELQPL